MSLVYHKLNFNVNIINHEDHFAEAAFHNYRVPKKFVKFPYNKNDLVRN